MLFLREPRSSDGTAELKAEIARLEEDKVILNRQIDGLEQRIKELEDASVKEVLDFGVEQLSRGHDKYHIITTAQIDGAWEMTNDSYGPYGEHLRVGLGKLGIVRCEKCRPEDYSMEWGEGGILCSSCNGHEWVVEADDE